jgi:RNA polymerase sigma-70 factor (ECF subfamily)
MRRRTALSHSFATDQAPPWTGDGGEEREVDGIDSSLPFGGLAERFECEVIPLRNRLYGRALRLTSNPQDAEDLVQDTILHAYRGFSTFREGTNLMAWLYTIMHNTWINHCRKRQRRGGEVSVGQITDDQLGAFASRTENAFRSAEVVALESVPDIEVRAALMMLRETSRLTVYYADVEGLSYREIADMMDTCVGTVMSRLHRGRLRLRTTLLSVACQRGYGSTVSA